MYTVSYGGRNQRLAHFDLSANRVAVRTYSRRPVLTQRPFEIAPLSPEAHALLRDFDLELRLPEPGVEILQARSEEPDLALRDRARELLKAEESIRFAGRVLIDPVSSRPILYSENFFIQFHPRVTPTEARGVLSTHRLQIKRELSYARNAYFAAAPEGTGLEIFDIAAALLEDPRVELCHPELIRESRVRSFFPQQWHLGRTVLAGHDINAHANVVEAWQLAQGEGATIAIIDNGVDIDHEEFASAGKVVAPRDASRNSNDPRPGTGDNHGTACAGVACANGNIGASGVAPHACLMPIRLTSVLGSQAEAEAFAWAADRGADVISCSWGPPDGRWNDPTDPQHAAVVPLPDSTRLAIDYAVQNGRSGRGCVIFFAAGNGNESVDNDGYASYEKVIAVAACNDKGVHSAYSDAGRAVWCAFPSNDGYPSLTAGIWTTDRSGAAGYNPGNIERGDIQGKYTNSFGGTSSAAPGAAGVAALVLSRNPSLTAAQARQILRDSCDRIDPAGGRYAPDGHSPLYGYGRINAAAAVRLATSERSQPQGVHAVNRDVAILDLHTSSLQLRIAETEPLKSIRVGIDIEHTYIGDLVVRVVPPAAMEAPAIVLHDRAGGSTHNLQRLYDDAAVPALRTLVNKQPAGIWTLEVADEALEDQGKIRSFRLELAF